MFCLTGGNNGKEALSTKEKEEKENPWFPEEDEDQDRKEGTEEAKEEEKKTLNGLRNFGKSPKNRDYEVSKIF